MINIYQCLNVYESFSNLDINLEHMKYYFVGTVGVI